MGKIKRRDQEAPAAEKYLVSKDLGVWVEQKPTPEGLEAGRPDPRVGGGGLEC